MKVENAGQNAKESHKKHSHNKGAQGTKPVREAVSFDDSFIDVLDYDEIIAAKVVDKCDTRHNISLRRNTIVFVFKGDKLILNHGARHKVSEGHIFFMQGGGLISKNLISKEAGFYQSYCIFFSNMFLFKFLRKHRYLLESIANKAHGDIYKIKSDIYINEQIKSLQVYFDNKDRLNLSVFKEIIKLKTEALFLLLMNRSDKVFASFVWSILRDFAFLKDLLSDKEQEFSSVKDMAKMFDSNISLFSKKFKMSFDITPKEWIDNEKFEKAKLLVEFSNKNITEICQELNIHSVPWFIERFKARYGITPKKLQQQNFKAIKN